MVWHKFSNSKIVKPNLKLDSNSMYTPHSQDCKLYRYRVLHQINIKDAHVQSSTMN
jgi:hypothetical protein